MRCMALRLGLLLFLGSSTSLYAGKMELTTYYPAPYGEYSKITVKGKTNDATPALQASGSAGTGLVVTNANQVGIGTLTPTAALEVAGVTKTTGGLIIHVIPAGGTAPTSANAADGQMWLDMTVAS